MKPLERLRAHSEEFRREILQPAPGVHVAVGFAASNIAMIETSAGLVIVDTSESTAAAAQVLAGFRRISDRPIVAIIVTILVNRSWILSLPC